MELRVTAKHGQIGIRTADAVLSMRSFRPSMTVSTQRPELNVQNRPVRVKIDQSQCFSEAGLKGIFELNRDIAQEGRQAVLEGIAQMVADGNTMAAIQHKSEAVVELAVEKSLPLPADFNITFIPRSRPLIEVEGGVSFNPTPGRVNLQVEVRPTEIKYQPYQIDIYLAQRPEFHYEFVGQNIDIEM